MADLWDDSALITAFNSAMAKYKDMHGLSGKSKPHGHKIFDGETEVLNSESTSLMHDSTDQGEVEKAEKLQEVEPLGMESLDTRQQKHDDILVESLVEKTYIYGQEGDPSTHETFSGYPADYRKQERESILSQLQILAEQQHQLEQQLTYLGNTNMEEATTSAACNSYPLSQHCSKEQYQTYPAMADYCYTCLSHYWNAYYNSLGSSSSLPSAASCSTTIQCQHCTAPGDPFQNNLQEPAGKPCEASIFSSASQKLPDASTLPEMVRIAVAEATKAAESQHHIGETNKTPDAGLSDVALAWFLAGFHTSRYLSRGDECQ